eukprot:jgi/Psemu1/3916/gm1.3916_g
MPVNRWHTQWGLCLSHGPKKRWNKTILANREIDHSREKDSTNQPFFVVHTYINAITLGDLDAKGTMIAAYEHQHMAKPMEVSEHDCFSRIDTILNNIIMLPGDDHDNLTEQQRKRMFFKTHPRSWQDAYIDTAVIFREDEDLDEDLVEEMVDKEMWRRRREMQKAAGWKSYFLVDDPAVDLEVEAMEQEDEAPTKATTPKHGGRTIIVEMPSPTSRKVMSVTSRHQA